MPAIVAGMITDVTWFIACDCAADGRSVVAQVLGRPRLVSDQASAR
jgi:hypothetical protein